MSIIISSCSKDNGDNSSTIIPVAEFAANKTSITPGESITFTDQSENSPTSWRWDFGDETISDLQNPTHTFISVGNYTVELTVSNIAGINSTTKSISVAPRSNSNIYGSVSDAEGNIYKTVSIGTQVWMAENLKATKYVDGLPIPNIKDASAWSSLQTDAYCIAYNDTNNYNIYGNFYNWQAVETGKLCPLGWHVPTDTEWTILENYLIANGYNYDGSIDNDNNRSTNNYIGKSLATSTSWTQSDIVGSVGSLDYNNKLNLSGFSGLPSGGRFSNGEFKGLNYNGIWHSSTEYSSTECLVRGIKYNETESSRLKGNKKTEAYSVRCIKD